jgi:hypothetical protein
MRFFQKAKSEQNIPNVLFEGFLGMEAASELRCYVHLARNDGNKNLMLHIDSHGGVAMEAEGLYYFLKGIAPFIEVNTNVVGYAESAAAILFMCGKRKYASVEKRIGFHAARKPDGSFAIEQEVTESGKRLISEAGFPQIVRDRYLDDLNIQYPPLDYLKKINFVSKITDISPDRYDYEIHGNCDI